MRDLKIKPGMDTPKAKQKNPAPKDAESILKKHMDERQTEKEPENRDPVHYASMALTVWKLADSTISQQKVCQERLFDFYHCGILDASKNEEVRHAADIYRY